MSPKYNIFNFTESYRAAEHKHTILLPVVMGFVVFFSFWLVVKTRPTARKKAAESAGIATITPATRDIDILSRPPKIDLKIDFDSEPGLIPSMGEAINLDPAIMSRNVSVAESPEIPLAKVIKARPVSKDGLPLVSLENYENRFTDWMTPGELNQHILALNQGQEISFWDRGHWIVAVEGRWSNRRQEYRIVYERVPENSDFQWRYRIAQSRDTFTRNIQELRNDGFTLVQSQVYELPDKSSQYQAVWQKLR